jgi:predicted enzyme related to lactoylglutathione lyase
MSIPPRSPGTVAWVDLSTPDVEAVADFYAGLLGCRSRPRTPRWVGT